MKTAAARGDIQFAALPFIFRPDGHLMVLLLTSRETKRRVIPKGWPIRGLKPREVAAREDGHEAGQVLEAQSVSAGPWVRRFPKLSRALG